MDARRKRRSRTKRGREAERAAQAFAGGRRVYPVELRWRVVREAVEGDVSLSELERVFGVSAHTIQEWVRRYHHGGIDALVPLPSYPMSRARAAGAQAKRDAVAATRREHPEWGTRRIRDELRRDEGLGVSETAVRRTLHEEGLMPERSPAAAREHPPRRFERAEPNQLWQSDIFTFLLRKHERLYLTAFMDDHSRFLVSHVVAHHQRSSLVMEALRRAIADFGPPREALTDQGRQYTAWRGETEFEQELRHHGIRHVKSRPQHPQTLGKIERFWKTLWDEFLSRTVFADFADCVRRLGLFVQAYNFQRPHQALDGLVPADRFFRAAPQVRAAIENSVADNAMRLAHEQPVRKPFYLVGRLGDRDLSISAGGAGLTVRVGDEQPQTIVLDKEHDDESTQASRRVTTEAAPLDDRDPEAAPTAASFVTTDAGVADDPAGPRRDGAPALPARAERAQWRAQRPGGGGAGADLAADLPEVRDTGARGDARGVDAGRVAGWRGGELEPSDRGPREADRAARARQAASGAPAAPDAPDRATWAGDDGRWPQARQPLAPEVGGRWGRIFAAIEADERDPDPDEHAGDGPGVDGGADGCFDADAGWRGRALSWDRKLAGQDAPVYARPAEVCGGEEDELDVHANARRARERTGALRDGAESHRGPDDHGERGPSARHVASALPDSDAPGSAGAGDGARTAASWPPGDTDSGAAAARGQRQAAPGQRPDAPAARDDGPAAGRGERHAPWPDEPEPWATAREDVEPDDDEGAGG